MIRILVIFFALLLAAPAQAHKPSDSYLRVTAHDNGLILQWDAGLNDLVRALDLDRNADGALTWGELQSNAAGIYAAASRWIQLDPNANCVLQPEPLALIRHAGELYAALEWRGVCERVPQTIDYEFRFDRDPDHRVFVSVTADGAQRSTVLSPSNRVLQLSTLGTWNTFREFLWQGMTHIWQGYDHLAFLLLLILPAFRARKIGVRRVSVELAKIVTAFTVAHSITLTAAALGFIVINPVIIEVLIAVSVIVAAVLVSFPRASGKGMWLALGFGLLHGFGFANALAGLVNGGETPLVALASFNLGVEAGQLIVVLAALPLLWPLRGTRAYRFGVIPVASIGFMLIACYWLFERLSATVSVV